VKVSVLVKFEGLDFESVHGLGWRKGGDKLVGFRFFLLKTLLRGVPSRLG
jgi:hypothetical protein